MRPAGTTVIIEDVAVPIDKLAAATADLQAALVKHGYPEEPPFVEERRQALPALEHVVDRLDERRLLGDSSFTATWRAFNASISGFVSACRAARGSSRRGRGFSSIAWTAAMRAMTSLAKGEFVVLWTFTKLRRA